MSWSRRNLNNRSAKDFDSSDNLSPGLISVNYWKKKQKERENELEQPNLKRQFDKVV